MVPEVKALMDCNGSLIRVGDHVAYATRVGNSAELKQGIVESFKDRRLRVRYPNGRIGGYKRASDTIKVHL